MTSPAIRLSARTAAPRSLVISASSTSAPIDTDHNPISFSLKKYT